jgi:hypothetical protein
LAAGRLALGLALAATLLLAPSLVLGTLPSHSSPQNLTWATQFADQFRAGILYPRWLPDSFDGLGGPAFYFYPPIAFWVDALLSVVTFDALSVSYRLSLASLLLLWASGIAMHAWLKAEATSPRVALYGALAYMAGPYHLLDHYYRGAYAEFAAYAVLPLVALSVRQIADRQRFGPVFFAITYAALPMAHLPTALLISLTALPMYVLYRGWRLGVSMSAARFFVRCALSGMLGLGLAAVYLVPALTLEDWISAEKFWTPDYQVENWFLLTPERWAPGIDMMQIIAWFAAAYGIAAIGVAAVLAQRNAPQRWCSEASFWTFVCIVCLLLIAGLLPWFWRIPFVAKVQFPWRLMIVVEFAVITALCLAPLAQSRATSFIFVAAIFVLVPAVSEMVQGIVLRSQVPLAQQDTPQDVKQYMPAGFSQRPGARYADLGMEPLMDVPTISCTPAADVCSAENERFGTMRLAVESNAATTVILRRFFFPAWQIGGPVAITPTVPLQLVSFVAPAGRHTFHLQRAVLPAEQWGWALSGLSLILLLVGSALSWRARRP